MLSGCRKGGARAPQSGAGISAIVRTAPGSVTTGATATSCKSSGSLFPTRNCGPKHFPLTRTRQNEMSSRHRDATMILVAYRHGFRASEWVGLRWDQIDFEQATLAVRRV